ncbi:unknown protein [Seminavis robusta]|uniref:Uncharacterized protein n=1 Tax=Seminavis robusta TaxID=568900 RepID=A0A9N8HZN8_9STRA|nr:unknown protein [Seminavis robusta]|eukprot:Sro2337_g323870.1 n/a (169) ;mRNA; f:5607-6113
MGETRHVAIGFETYDGTIRDYRGSATFDRHTTAIAYRFVIRGVQVKRNADGTLPNDVTTLEGPIQDEELRLTSRFEWFTKFQKIKGNKSSGRIIRMRFLRSTEEEHPQAIRQIDIIVPKLGNNDKGKLLEFAVVEAAALVDANIARRKFEEEKERQLRAAAEAKESKI